MENQVVVAQLISINEKLDTLIKLLSPTVVIGDVKVFFDEHEKKQREMEKEFDRERRKWGHKI